ncbi:MAG: hypothetical protein ACETWM_12270 [Candidatus Lokiarchaeia archaeon]
MDLFLFLPISGIYISLVIVVFAVLVTIIGYLVKVYRERREKTTFALLAFFLAYGVLRFYEGLGEPRVILTQWVIEISLGIILAATALLIPIALLRIKKLYLFPPIVAVALLVVNSISSLSRDTTVHFVNLMFYLNGYNLWNPLLDWINIRWIRNDYIAAIVNPVDALLIPDLSYLYLLISGLLLALPAIILFSIIAWREKDGKALGFTLGLVIIFIGGAISGTHALIYIVFELAGISIIGAGIIGLIDKYVYKKTET